MPKPREIRKRSNRGVPEFLECIQENTGANWVCLVAGESGGKPSYSVGSGIGVWSAETLLTLLKDHGGVSGCCRVSDQVLGIQSFTIAFVPLSHSESFPHSALFAGFLPATAPNDNTIGRIEAFSISLGRYLSTSFLPKEPSPSLHDLAICCAVCDKLRSPSGHWVHWSDYWQLLGRATISHTTCEDCASLFYGVGTIQ